jgi:hypothetical protein
VTTLEAEILKQRLKSLPKDEVSEEEREQLQKAADEVKRKLSSIVQQLR